ncbi:tRNA1(Val) (adenine(37)-N6)-methyltransferase [Lichenihabitans psoromatis]|uniref:tRNA1(Val) (adenine(37)-N6)-methyltransferase n=1 Tax=Lichenihabitans psoromatis TaxID=2528642 RepID=UPI001036B913|nr:methyltransferase [Lichenihabitans psoromatis]
MGEVGQDLGGAPDITLTALLDGRLSVYQPCVGHKAGTDAILLAAAAPDLGQGTFVDVGSGVGTVGLLVALRQPDTTGLLLERGPVVADLARRNVALNDMGDRLRVLEADLFDGATRGTLRDKADLVITNPPFFLAGRSRVSPHPGKAAAHVLDAGPGEQHDGHGHWLRAALSLLGPHGRLLMIHRPEALPYLLAAATGRLGEIRIMPIHARAGDPAIRILMMGTRGSRAPLTIADRFVLHGVGGAFTPAAAAVHRGEPLSLM